MCILQLYSGCAVNATILQFWSQGYQIVKNDQLTNWLTYLQNYISCQYLAQICTKENNDALAALMIILQRYVDTLLTWTFYNLNSTVV